MKNDDFEMAEEYDMSAARRGPIVAPDARKTRITIRIDSDVLGWFREQVENEGGGSYQTRINDALRRHVESHVEPLEEILRRVIREELQRLEPRPDQHAPAAPAT